MLAYYGLDDAINFFFASNTGATRQQCDDFVQPHEPSPVPIQASFSYTVVVGTTKVFQFRVHDSSVDMHLTSLAKIVHPQFVATCKYHGVIDQSRPLHIYEMENLRGTAYIITRNISSV